MGAKRYTVLLFALVFAPSAYMAWNWRDMPHLGVHHDDALYLVGAKSLAEGHGYRIESLPGEPFQTKYPPLLSGMLAVLWKFGPPFPENLQLLTLFTWLMLPVCLWLMRVLFQSFGFGPKETWLLTLLAAVQPLTCLLSVTLLSDLIFLTFFLACLLLAERALDSVRPASLALAAGAIGGIAYLTRTAALPILVAAPLCFLFRRQFGRAMLFCAGMLPAVLGWQFWMSAHMLQTTDPALLYYTSYLGMARATVHPGNLAIVVWRNLDALLRGICKSIIFDVAIPLHPHLQQVIGIAIIAGVVRLARRTRRIQYPAAAAGFALLLLGYFFPSNERLLLPIYPLVLMGFWTEAKNLWTVVQLAWMRGHLAERLLAAVAASVIAAMAGLIAVSYVVGHFAYLPKLRAATQSERIQMQPAYDWIKSHTAPTATIYAYIDPLLYLYTGRHALGLPASPAKIYEDSASTQATEFPQLTLQQAREHHLDYLLITNSDGYMEGLKGKLWELAAHDPKLRKEYASSSAAVYTFLAENSGSRSLTVAVPYGDETKGSGLPSLRTYTATYPASVQPARRQ